MRVPAAALAATLAFGATPGHAQASELFDMFQQICGVTHGDSAQALAVADKAGWMPIPDAMMASLSKTAPVENPQGRMRTNSASLMLLFVGLGDIPEAGGLKGGVCAIGSLPPQAGLNQEAASFAVVPKNEKLSAGRTGYIWREDNGSHIAIADEDAAIKADVEKGPVNFLVEEETDKLSILILATVSK